MDDGDRAHERIGELIAGRYRLERLLGAGGMGAVYEAVHEFTQRRVAVKLMHPAFARSRIAAERFVREAQAPSSIGHPGIVEVLDGGRAEDGSLYLVLELLHGQTLGAAMRAATLLPARLVPIALELLEALGAAHAAGFVHRDIKPDNVFLVADEDRPHVKLLDFGVISVLSDDTRPGLTQAGSVLGTPLYMSPEQALGRRVDERSDLWSVGAVCYQALTGRAPFAGASAQALIISISTEEHLPLSVVRPGLPLRLVKAIERALSKHVDKRWQSAEEMAEALRHGAGADEHASASPTAVRGLAVPEAALRSQQGGERAAKSARAPFAIAIGITALAVAAGAWALTRPMSEPAMRNGSAAGAEVIAASPSPSPSPSPSALANPRPPSLPNAPAAGLDADVISSALRAHDLELQRCYEDAVVAELMRAGDAPQAEPQAVRLDAELTIDSSGAVQHLELRGDAPEAMRSCTRAAIQGWRFPAAQGPTDIRFPMVFQPNVVRR